MRTVSIRLSNAGRLGAHWTRRPLGNRAPALGDTDGPQRMSLYGERRIALAAGAEVFHRQRRRRFRLWAARGRCGVLLGVAHRLPARISGAPRGAAGARRRRCALLLTYCQSYAQKIEVYDPAVGSFPLSGERYGGARYHHVSVDMQLHVEEAATENSEVEDDVPVFITAGDVLTGRGVTIKRASTSSRAAWFPRGRTSPSVA
jgi:hypothetical protein